MIVLRPGQATLGLGHLAALAAALCGALASVIVRKIGQDERSAVLMVYPMLANVLVMGAALPFVYHPMPVGHLAGFATVAVFAFVAMLGLISAYRAGEAVIVAPMQYSQILWATLYGGLFFHEVPDGGTALGATVIIASGIYIVLRESRGQVSENRPVLESRSRPAGIMPRVGAFRRRAAPAGEGGAKVAGGRLD